MLLMWLVALGGSQPLWLAFGFLGSQSRLKGLAKAGIKVCQKFSHAIILFQTILAKGQVKHRGAG
jgi:hypothetical protein